MLAVFSCPAPLFQFQFSKSHVAPDQRRGIGAVQKSPAQHLVAVTPLAFAFEPVAIVAPAVPEEYPAAKPLHAKVSYSWDFGSGKLARTSLAMV